MTAGDAAVRSLDGLAALWRTFEYLFVHGLIIVLVTVAAVSLARFAAAKGDEPGRLDLGAYCGAFATFGVATSYFLSLGLNAASASGNSLLQTFVGPFISLLTAAVAYAASKSRDQLAKNDLVLGVTCFLLSCILSYETFNGQILYGMGTSVGIEGSNPPEAAPDNGLAPPSEGNNQAGNAVDAAPSTLSPPTPSDEDQLAPPKQ